MSISPSICVTCFTKKCRDCVYIKFRGSAFVRRVKEEKKEENKC